MPDEADLQRIRPFWYDRIVLAVDEEQMFRATLRHILAGFRIRAQATKTLGALKNSLLRKTEGNEDICVLQHLCNGKKINVSINIMSSWSMNWLYIFIFVVLVDSVELNPWSIQ